MRILLVGEYSNVHWTLAEGLRALGHDVTVVSSGDGWKNYPRDIDLRRRNLPSDSQSSGLKVSSADFCHDSAKRVNSMALAAPKVQSSKFKVQSSKFKVQSSKFLGTVRYLADLARIWPRLRGYDVVQLINPVFIELRAERILPFYRFLRRHNHRVVLGAFGIDHYWVRVGMDCHTFRYSDFNFGSSLRSYPFMDTMIADWLHGPKGELNRTIAEDADAIVTGLYEYEACYRPFFPQKTTFIPFPIDRSAVTPTTLYPALPSNTNPKLNCFIGIQRSRSAYKGTDIMLHALERLQADYTDRVEIRRAENVPFAEYQQMMNTSHVLLDQLYSYTPAMNALLAMAKGLIVVGGGEPEHYDLLGEDQLRPIINVQPTEQDVYDQMLQRLVLQPENIRQLQLDSIEYIRRHHDHIAVARRYEKLYKGLL